MVEKIPLLLLPKAAMRKLGRRLRGMGTVLVKMWPALRPTLAKMGFDMEPEEYAVGSLFSAMIYGFVFFLACMAAFAVRGPSGNAVQLSLVIGIAMWLMFFILHLIYPSIILKKTASKESKDLLFALREIMTNVSSGIPLYDSMKNVGNGGYGYVSSDFEWAMKLVDGGVPETEALKRLALRTDSEYMKRAIWQIVNALESGASMETALGDIVESLEGYIYREIKSYSSALNFLMLIYVMAAAVLPSLGITFMVLLSAFSGLGVTMQTIILMEFVSAVMQIAMIGYMTTTRPEIFGG